MTAYYNEIDPYAAAWLRQLIKEGRIADGEVDTRSIVDVRPGDLVAFKQCHFFAGLGGWSGALRLAGFPDNRPVWTGSCPCQPFSLAGKQKGFDDDRHLWPVWRELIAERRPAKVFGEQVASAAQWLGLVRGDLEALDYAVGAIPIEAASAGADHLRDRFWFVGNRQIVAKREPNHEGHSVADGGEAWPISGGAGNNGFALGDASGSGLAFGSISEVERGDLRNEGPSVAAAGDQGDTLAYADSAAIWIEPGRGSGPRGAGAGIDRDNRQDSNMADSEVLTDSRQRVREEQQWLDHADVERGDWSGELSWVIGADGKARRVKSGIRLLAHGVPARVAKLRALGNAIDLRPAAAFIKATM